ncbi:hypothetical protein M405DRAFT_782130 [Rhizopogon salebrosus TDB-379]|nr:hypothetical protein M405DRAFT_782130 [Rhizopogon salebrosus TDB-379]
MTNPRPRRQYEWEAEVVEYINYVSDKTRIRSVKALARPYLDGKIPILGPHFVPPSYLHARKRSQSEPVVNPEISYLKPLRVIHPFYYPELARCPRCNCADGIQWDGWTGTGPRDVHGLMLDEAAIGTQLRCEHCKNDPTSKKGHCFATTNPGFWHGWSHWSIPGDIPIFFYRCAVTHELFDLLIELRLSSTAGTLAENVRREWHYCECPNPLRVFSDPYDANEYNDKPISRDMVSEVFQEFVSGTRERESEEYLRTLSGTSISFDNTFRAATKATVTSPEKQKSRVLKGGIISLMNENSEIVSWRFCHGQSNAEISELLDGLKTRCEALDVPPPEIFVADNCCHVRSAVTVIFPDAAMKLDVWHFIMRYATVILNPSKNPHRKEVVAEISACILKKHAEAGNPAEYWDRNEQETRLVFAFEKWSCNGMVWSAGAYKVHEEQLKHVRKGCLERLRQDIRTDGSRVEGSHKGWNSLQRVHTSGIVTFTGLCHDFVLRRNIRVAFSRATKSDFVSSTHGSHHIHLVDRIAKLFNRFRLEEKATSTCCLPELKEVPSKEHFGLVKSGFATTFGGLLEIKTEDSPVELDMSGPQLLEALSSDSGDVVDLVLQSTRSKILEELEIDPQLLSIPQVPIKPGEVQPSLLQPHTTATLTAEVTPSPTHVATDVQPQRPMRKRKVDETIVISETEHEEDSGQLARDVARKPPRKIMRHSTTSNKVGAPIAGTAPSNQGTPSATLDEYLKPRSRLPYCNSKALPRRSMAVAATSTSLTPSHQQPEEPASDTPSPIPLISPVVNTTATTTTTTTTTHDLTPIPRPPGMTRSQHFFTIATRIDARAMQISGDIEFHLFMEMREEFAWISFKMAPKQWALATETYNTRLEAKNHANGLETVRKHPQALLRKLGQIEVVVMNRVAKNDFKSRSGSETFWRRHCHAIELIKAEPGKKLRKAHTCSRCKTIMYPAPENSGYNHRRGFCADGAKQVSKNEPPPPWPQPPGVFSEGKHFHPRAFLETVKQIYEQVFLRPSGESPALEQEAFVRMLLDRSTTLESGTVLFKLYEELEIDSSTPDALLTIHGGIQHLRVEYLQEHWAS